MDSRTFFLLWVTFLLTCGSTVILSFPILLQLLFLEHDTAPNPHSNLLLVKSPKLLVARGKDRKLRNYFMHFQSVIFAFLRHSFPHHCFNIHVVFMQLSPECSYWGTFPAIIHCVFESCFRQHCEFCIITGQVDHWHRKFPLL